MTIPPIKLSSILDFNLILLLIFLKFLFQYLKLFFHQFFYEIKFADISPFFLEINLKIHL